MTQFAIEKKSRKLTRLLTVPKIDVPFLATTRVNYKDFYTVYNVWIVQISKKLNQVSTPAAACPCAGQSKAALAFPKSAPAWGAAGARYRSVSTSSSRT